LFGGAKAYPQAAGTVKWDDYLTQTHEDVAVGFDLERHVLDTHGMHEIGHGKAGVKFALIRDQQGGPSDDAVVIQKGVYKSRTFGGFAQHVEGADCAAAIEQVIGPDSIPLRV